MSGHKVTLRGVRSTRAAPPGQAADDPERRAIYTAALEQFEQLLRASQVVSPAARPLPLFYALSQAGRAIVAAFGDQPQIDGHGLQGDRRNPPPADLLHRHVKRDPKRDGRDAFGAVSRAIQSPDLETAIELGAVWAALPDTYRIPNESWLPAWRSALPVLDETAYRGSEGETQVQVLCMSGNPHCGEVETLQGRYPSLPADTKIGLKSGGEELGPGNWIAVLTWSAEHDIDEVVPYDADRKGRTLLPSLPDQKERPAPLMLWWLLLFGLSVFARYHPELWAEALDVDASEHAVPLEGLLDGALETVPSLVHDVLLG